MSERSYIIIEPFMIDLNLPKTELLIYALIYQFSKQKQGCFYGSQGYLALQIGVTRQASNKALGVLETKGLIDKVDNLGRIEYTTVTKVGATVVAGVRRKVASTVDKEQQYGQPQLQGIASTVDKGATVVDKNSKYSCTNINKYKNNKQCECEREYGDPHPSATNLEAQSDYYNESEQEPINHPLVPLIAGILPNVIINTDPVLTEQEYRQIAEEYDKSSWLRQTFGTLLKIHKNKARILGGDYRDFKETKLKVQNSREKTKQIAEQIRKSIVEDCND